MVDLKSKKEIEEDCDKPEILAQFNGKCSKEQVMQCHGIDRLNELEKAGFFDKD